MSRKRARVEIDYRFVPVPHDLIADPRVSAQACRLWGWLHVLDWRHEAPDPKRLQALMEAGERSIYRWLRELEAAGWLTWQRNTYDLSHRFLLNTTGAGGDAATVAQIRAALDGTATIEDIRQIVESADKTRQTATDASEAFATDGKTDPDGKSATRIKSSATRISRFATSGKSSLNLALPDAVNRPPSEDQNHENHVGGGDRARARKNGGTPEPPRHVAYLASQGMGAAAEFAGLDPDACIADFDARRADGIPIGTITKQWRIRPPTPENTYAQHRPAQRESAAHRSRRSAVVAHDADRDRRALADLERQTTERLARRKQ